METFALFGLVLILGIRHGIDADHLAYIDGVTRYNWQNGKAMARWVGTFFSIGHGVVVTMVAVLLGTVSSHFTFPARFDAVATWVSVISLFLIGTLNAKNLLRTANRTADFKISGIKGKWIPTRLLETQNPLMIVLVGAIFALAADTVSQTAIWAMAAKNAGGLMPLLLGLTFTFGMVATDTFDSWISYKMFSRSDQMGQKVSRLMGWLIVLLAYGIATYEVVLYFRPKWQLDFQLLGAVLFTLFLTIFVFMYLRSKTKLPDATDSVQ